MAEFVKGSELNSEIESVFENANKRLVIVSPYIKLHSRFIDILKGKKEKLDLEIIIVFGKKTDYVWYKSLNKDDLDFLMDFPSISIKYEKNLHAKYYSNETKSVLSSMNLYDFSQNNNIEFGIVTKGNILGSLTGNVGANLDKNANEYFNSVIENADLVFQKKPVFESKIMGLSKKYIESKIEIDKISSIYEESKKQSKKKETNNREVKKGYCIRTGKEIEYNIKMPLSKSAYSNWVKFKNTSYPEKYCHYSGEKSNGDTSFSKPILKKNWKKS